MSEQAYDREELRRQHAETGILFIDLQKAVEKAGGVGKDLEEMLASLEKKSFPAKKIKDAQTLRKQRNRIIHPPIRLIPSLERWTEECEKLIKEINALSAGSSGSNFRATPPKTETPPSSANSPPPISTQNASPPWTITSDSPPPSLGAPPYVGGTTTPQPGRATTSTPSPRYSIREAPLPPRWSATQRAAIGAIVFITLAIGVFTLVPSAEQRRLESVAADEHRQAMLEIEARLQETAKEKRRKQELAEANWREYQAQEAKRQQEVVAEANAQKQAQENDKRRQQALEIQRREQQQQDTLAADRAAFNAAWAKVSREREQALSQIYGQKPNNSPPSVPNIYAPMGAPQVGLGQRQQQATASTNYTSRATIGRVTEVHYALDYVVFSAPGRELLKGEEVLVETASGPVQVTVQRRSGDVYSAVSRTGISNVKVGSTIAK